MSDKWVGPANKALDKMRRAHKQGTGCYLTREMIQSLHLTIIGQMWSEPITKDASHD